jgi:hypothetical protein
LPRRLSQSNDLSNPSDPAITTMQPATMNQWPTSICGR